MIETSVSLESARVLAKLGAYKSTLPANHSHQFPSNCYRCMRPKTWIDAERILNYRPHLKRRKLAPNTYLMRDDDGRPTVYLYDQPIVTYFPGGAIIDDYNFWWNSSKLALNRIITFSFACIRSWRMTFGRRESRLFLDSNNGSDFDYKNHAGKSGIRKNDLKYWTLWEPPTTIDDEGRLYQCR